MGETQAESSPSQEESHSPVDGYNLEEADAQPPADAPAPAPSETESSDGKDSMTEQAGSGPSEPSPQPSPSPSPSASPSPSPSPLQQPSPSPSAPQQKSPSPVTPPASAPAAPTSPSSTPSMGQQKPAGYSTFSFQLPVHAEHWDLKAQDAFKSAFAQQVGLPAEQVALSTAYSVVADLVLADTTGAASTADALGKAVAAYLGLPASSVTFAGTGSTRRRLLGDWWCQHNPDSRSCKDWKPSPSPSPSPRSESAPVAAFAPAPTPVPAEAVDQGGPLLADTSTGAAAVGTPVALPGKLSVSVADAGAASVALAALVNTQSLGSKGLAVSMQSVPVAEAATKVNATLTSADAAKGVQQQVQQAAAPTNLQRLLVQSGVSDAGTPTVTQQPKYVSIASVPVSAAPKTATAETSSGGFPIYAVIGGVVGGVVLLAVIAGVFIVRRRRKRMAQAGSIEGVSKRSKSGGAVDIEVASFPLPHAAFDAAELQYQKEGSAVPMQDIGGQLRLETLPNSVPVGVVIPSDSAFAPGAAANEASTTAVDVMQGGSSGGVAAFLRRVTQGRSKESETPRTAEDAVLPAVAATSPRTLSAGAAMEGTGLQPMPPLAQLLATAASANGTLGSGPSHPSSGYPSFTSANLPAGDVATTGPSSAAGDSLAGSFTAGGSGLRHHLVPPLQLPALQPGVVQDPNEAFQLGIKAAIAQMAAAVGMPGVSMPPGALTPGGTVVSPSQGQTPPGASGVASSSGTSRTSSVTTNANAKQNSARKDRSARRRRQTPRVWTAEEEEANDTHPLGSKEQAHGPMPNESVLRKFCSTRQRPDQGDSSSEVVTDEARNVLERTAALVPGQQFAKYFWITEGSRVTPTAVVRNAVHKVTKQPVSIKFFGQVDDFRREASLHGMATLSQHFVPVMYYAEEGAEDLPPFIISERGDFTLADAMSRSRPPPQQQKILLHDAAAAVAHLHSLGVVLTHLTPASLMFFGKDGCWKLVEFDSWAQKGQAISSYSYCLRYAAPEVLAADVAGTALVADPAIDLWTLGVIAFEMLTGTRFFNGLDDFETMRALLGHRTLPTESNDGSSLALVTDAPAQRLLRNLIRRDPNARWDTFRVVTCQWFRSSDFQAYRMTS